MGVAGRTAPGSGMEHTVSHLLEMAEHGGGEPPLHGAKVGVLSVLAALLWRRVRGGGPGELGFPEADEMEERVLEAFSALDASGDIGRECWRDYSKKLERWHASRAELETLLERWGAFDAELDRLLASPERLIAALREAGAPTRLSELGIDEADVRWALANCHLMRNRFTVADLVPTVADARLARLLEVKRGTPLLHIDQVDYDELGHAVMLSHEWHLADAFELIVNRRSLPAEED